MRCNLGVVALAAGSLLTAGFSFAADVPHTYENRTAREIRCLDVIRYARGN